MLREIQFWNLQVKPDNSAVLTCERDEDDIALTQEIEYTDFPLKKGQYDFFRLITRKIAKISNSRINTDRNLNA